MFVHTPESPTLNEDNGSTPFDLGADGAKTLHTPELLNSLMSLAPPAFPASYSQYQESSGSGSGSGGGGGGSGPPSLQQTTSSLIKEGLKVSIRSRRASTGQALFTEERREIKTELTSVDEARRQRRRERNKVAATKCRNKKKIETQHLIVDSERQVNQHNSLRLEIIQLLQERSQLVSALTSHLPCCTSTCADSTALALSRCSRTPPPEVPRPLSPLTPLTSPDSERRPSGSSTCSWGSVGEMALESACALPYGGGGFPCGGSVMANPAMTPSPTASVSPGYGASAGASTSGYGMYSPPGVMAASHPAAMMLSSPPCPAPAMVAPPHGQTALMSPPGPPTAKMNMGSPTGCAMYAGAQQGYMPPPVSTPAEYQYYGCGPTAPTPAPPGYASQAGGGSGYSHGHGHAHAHAHAHGHGHGPNYAGYGRMC